LYLSKAHEFLTAADDSAARENYIAAVGNAVHATIAPADAVSSVHLRARWKGDHSKAADHVGVAGIEGEVCAKCLRRVIPLKHQAEYDPEPMSKSKATGAVKAARLAVAAAEAVIAGLS
jgi:hypothetical protein